MSQKNSFPEWHEIPNDGCLKTFDEQTDLHTCSLQFSRDNAIVLPNTKKSVADSEGSILFAQTAKEVLQILTEGGLRASLYDDGREKREIVRKSAEVVLPVLLFIGNAAASIGMSVLASWIYDRFRKNETTKPVIKVEYLEIDEEKGINRWRKIEGSADEVRKLLITESQRLVRDSPANSSDLLIDNDKSPSDESWWSSYRKNSAHEALSNAKDLIKQAEDAREEKKKDISEKLYRNSLAKIREALLWEPKKKEHSKYLHEVGRRVNELFGCELEFKDGMYWVTCPVMLSHTQGGFSIGGSGKTLCSVCGKEMLECPHAKGNTYDGIIAKRHYNICNICGQEKCGHVEGETYDGVRAFGILVDLDVEEISYVSNPANPLCVIREHSISKSELFELLPEQEREQLNYGETTINCHHCRICKG